MTYVQIVNSVLRRLRESPVTSVSDNDYSTLIGDFVNQVKTDVENSWDWVRLRNTIQINTSSSVFRYTLTGLGDKFRILDVFNDTEDGILRRPPSQSWMTRQFLTDNPQSAQPLYYDFGGFSGDDPQVDLWPIPDGAYTINFNAVIPQSDLSGDSDVLTIPSLPIILGAYAMAVSERGEDGGANYNESDEAYRRALFQAINNDTHNVPNELTWTL